MKSTKKEIHSQPAITTPPVSFYDLQATLQNGRAFPFSQLRGKYVVLVNTASFCGYTGQYSSLEEIFNQHKDKLVVLGFPANDFGRQEPGSDDEIASFCQLNYGVTFPIMKKAPVLGPEAQPVYQWLTQPALNGWNHQAPQWNFCKYLVSPEGVLLEYYNAGVEPKEVVGRYQL